jgi:hypothetical protein
MFGAPMSSASLIQPVGVANVNLVVYKWVIPFGSPKPQACLTRTRTSLTSKIFLLLPASPLLVWYHSVGELVRLCFGCANSYRLVVAMLLWSDCGDRWWLRNWFVMCINCKWLGIWWIVVQTFCILCWLNPSTRSSDLLWLWWEKSPNEFSYWCACVFRGFD